MDTHVSCLSCSMPGGILLALCRQQWRHLVAEVIGIGKMLKTAIFKFDFFKKAAGPRVPTMIVV